MLQTFIVLALATTWPVGATMEDYLLRSRTTHTEVDPEMLAAQAQARSTLPTFTARLRQQNPADLEFSLQVTLQRAGDDVVVWLSPVMLTAQGDLVGTVDFVVSGSPAVRRGERLRVQPEQVLDWVIVEQTLRGEKLVGAFTVRLLEERERRGVVPFAALP